MAVNFKSIAANALLRLLDSKPLKKITIADILKESEISRQGFYNNFRDKQDVIQYIYLNQMIPRFHDMRADSFNYRESSYEAFLNYKKGYKFMKQALQLDGQNNLHDFMISHCMELDTDFHCSLLGTDTLSPSLRLATEYNAIASMEMSIAWILQDMPTEIDVVVDLITNMRSSCFSSLLDPETAQIFKAAYQL